MSDIDLNQPIFEDQYACSESQSLPGNRYSQEFSTILDITSEELEHKDFNFIRTNTGPRRSQTTTSQKSSPLKLNAALLRSQQNPTTHTRDSLHNQKTHKPSLLSTIGAKDRFDCQHKLFTIDQCEICHGLGYVEGSNNYVKFFEYVIGFKFGVCDSYREKRLLKRKKTEVNSFCNDYYQDVLTPPVRNSNSGGAFKIISKNSIKSRGSLSASVNLDAARQRQDSFTNMDRNSRERQSMVSGMQRFSMGSGMDRLSMGSNFGRMSYKSSKRCCKKQLVDQMNNMITIHQDYVCDLCQTQPIIGPRYHCNICEDYDICQYCFNDNQNAHEHQLEKIEKNGRCKQLENIVTMLVQPITSSTRLNLRPPPTIETLSDRPTTPRSVIR